MQIPKLIYSNRKREYSSYNNEIVDKVIYNYLFNGKSHRRLDEEFIKLSSDYSHGWQSMGILHYLGIRNEFKSLFKDNSLDYAISELEALNNREYSPIIESLNRVKVEMTHEIDDIKKTYWMISANSKRYRYAQSFQERGFIDWRQKSNFQRNDIVYIYCTKPLCKVMFKTRVEKINMTVDEIVDDKEFWIAIKGDEKLKSGRYCRLRLLEQVDNKELSLDRLLSQGLKIAPQRSVKLNQELISYLEDNFNGYYAEQYFPEVIENKYIVEGHLKTVTVNKYERSTKARNKCIENKGCFCHVCGMDFMKVYGELGRDFIHVHHIVPLSKINESYEVDYIKDLIPVCPNCHSMLHRKIDGRDLSIEQLKRILVYRKELGKTKDS